MSGSPGSRGWIAPLLIALAIALAIWPPMPSATDLSEPPAEFSVARAWPHLQRIATDRHPTGSAQNDEVRNYLLAELQKLNLETSPQDVTVKRSWAPDEKIALRNVVARLPGDRSTGAILISAHYDSVAEGPGASDNGAAVAALLETLRALRAGPPLHNDVIAAFTDGEELGLLGAHAFAQAHPWRDQVALVLNFDARGSGGPTLMFQASEDAGAWVRGFAESARQPLASSLMPAVYDEMPNDTDFSVYTATGWQGLNFARLGDFEHYHQPTDDVEHLDPRALAHHGETMLDLARHFGNLDLTAQPREDLIYFNPVGAWLVWYPSWLVWPLGACALLLWYALFALGRRRAGISGRAVVFAAITVAVAVGLATALGHSLATAALQATGGDTREPLSTTGRDGWAFAALACTAVAVASGTFAIARRWVRADTLAVATLAWWCVGLIAATIWLPDGSYALFWPTVPVALVLLFGFARPRVGHPRVGTYLAATLPAITISAPLLALLFQAMTLRFAAFGLPMVVLVLGLLWPGLWRSRRWVIVPSALAAAICWGVTWMSPGVM